MLIKGEALRFVEVKASGDVIRRNQLTRIKQLRAVGIQTDIARIDWVIDPNQIYVVVDVETTGGRSVTCAPKLPPFSGRVSINEEIIMKRSRFSEEQIIAILKEQENGLPTKDICA